jgi:2-succinyl-5-enolpyruvyl-6-hydroxy-3-cyclohexene-1-carboxylate synthase
MYGLDFMRTEERGEFAAALTAAFKNAAPKVIELRSDGERDHQVRQMLVESISKRLRS